MYSIWLNLWPLDSYILIEEGNKYVGFIREDPIPKSTKVIIPVLMFMVSEFY